MWLRLVVCAVLLASQTLVVPARAAPTANRAQAKKLFERGELKYQHGEFVKALALYKKAHKLYRHPAFIFNIAQCYRQLKKYSKALFFYRLFMSLQPTASNSAEVKRRIQEMFKKSAAAAALQKQVGRVSILSRPSGATVRVDRFTGSPAGVTPLLLKLRAGEHLVLIEKKGYHRKHQTVTVKAGRIATFTVKLQPLVAPRRAEPRRVEPSRAAPRRAEPRRGVTPEPQPRPARSVATPFWKRWWFWTGTVVSVLTLAGGSFVGYMALHDYRKYEQTRKRSNYDYATRNALAADLLLFGGGALAAATIIAAIVVQRRVNKAQRERSSALRLAPTCSGHGCGLLVRGRF